MSAKVKAQEELASEHGSDHTHASMPHQPSGHTAPERGPLICDLRISLAEVIQLGETVLPPYAVLRQHVGSAAEGRC